MLKGSDVVGSYSNASGGHGFLLSGGTYTTLDDPLATNGTTANGINFPAECLLRGFARPRPFAPSRKRSGGVLFGGLFCDGVSHAA